MMTHDAQTTKGMCPFLPYWVFLTVSRGSGNSSHTSTGTAEYHI